MSERDVSTRIEILPAEAFKRLMSKPKKPTRALIKLLSLIVDDRVAATGVKRRQTGKKSPKPPVQAQPE